MLPEKSEGKWAEMNALAVDILLMWARPGADPAKPEGAGGDEDLLFGEVKGSIAEESGAKRTGDRIDEEVVDGGVASDSKGISSQECGRCNVGRAGEGEICLVKIERTIVLEGGDGVIAGAVKREDARGVD